MDSREKRTGSKSNCTQYFFHDLYGSHGVECGSDGTVGNQKGLGAFVDLRRIAKSVFLLTLLIDIVFAVIFIFAKDAFPWLYLESSTAADVVEVATIASSLFLVAAFFQIFDGAQVVALGALRGLQDVVIPTWICFASYGLVGFTTMVYLGLYTP